MTTYGGGGVVARRRRSGGAKRKGGASGGEMRFEEDNDVIIHIVPGPTLWVEMEAQTWHWPRAEQGMGTMVHVSVSPFGHLKVR